MRRLVVFVFILVVFAFAVANATDGQITMPYLDDSSSKLSYSTILVDQITQLNIAIKNPMNESIYVNVTIFAAGVNSFPSNNSLVLLSPRLSNGTASIKKTTFVLIPKITGTFPIEVQLWWNLTKIDSRLFVLRVYSNLDPDLWGFWVRVNVSTFGLILLLLSTNFLNPTWKLEVYNKKTRKVEEYSKTMIFLIIAGSLIFLAYFFTSNYENYYAFMPFLLKLQGRIEPLVAACWIIGVISLGFAFFKRYEWSSTFSRFLLILLLLMLVSDWLLIPSPPFFGWETVVIVVFSVLINVLLKIVIEGAFEKVRNRRKKAE